MSPVVYLLIGLVAGGALGFLVGWLYRRGQTVAPDDRLANELRQQLAHRESELAKQREQVTTATSGQAAAEASRAAAEKYFWRNSLAAYKWARRDPSQPQLA